MVNSTAGIREFNTDILELFDHRKQINKIFIHTYRVPKFVKKEFQSEGTPWWEQKKTSHLSGVDFSQVCDKFVDIIIPGAGELDEVKRCFDSVESTLQKNHRLIIVDDESVMETSEFLHQYAATRNSFVKLIQLATPLGSTDTINAGLRASDAEYVILLTATQLPRKIGH